MIESLTPEQEAQIPVIRDQWLAIGLNTEPLNFSAAVRAATQCYNLVGLQPPQHFYQFASPLSGAMGAYLLSQDEQVRVVDSDEQKQALWHQTATAVRLQRRANGLPPKPDNGKTEDAAQVTSSLREHIRHMIYGAHDAGWLSFYAYMTDVLKIDLEKIQGLIALAKVCGWWAPYENAAILQDRPSAIHFDDEQRLHSETGAAIAYRDGFGVYAWHGVRVPKTWILDKPPSAADTLRWENIEQRHAACEMVGWHNILAELGATVVQRDDNPLVGCIMEAELPDVGRQRFLHVSCGTGRQFALMVPPDINTAREGQAWLHHDNPNTFILPAMRT